MLLATPVSCFADVSKYVIPCLLTYSSISSGVTACSRSALQPTRNSGHSTSLNFKVLRKTGTLSKEYLSLRQKHRQIAWESIYKQNYSEREDFWWIWIFLHQLCPKAMHGQSSLRSDNLSSWSQSQSLPHEHEISCRPTKRLVSFCLLKLLPWRLPSIWCYLPPCQNYYI